MPTTETPEPGIYTGVTMERYLSWPYVSASKLKTLHSSAAKVKYDMDGGPRRETPALALGTTIHACVLEPQAFHRTYVIEPEINKRTKVGKLEFAALLERVENKNQILISKDDYSTCNAIAKRLGEDEIAAEMLSGKGKNEVSVVWDHEATGLRCKARIDRLTDWKGFTCHIDLKSTVDASPDGYPYQCRKYNYHWSAALYLKGCEALAPGTRRFMHIAFEKVPPYDVGIYEFVSGDLQNQLGLEEGWRKCESMLAKYKECVDNDAWPSYGGPHPVEL